MAEAFINKRSNPAATTLTDLYVVPANTRTVISGIAICNRTGGAITIRLSVAPLGAADDPSHYLYYDYSLPANTTLIVGKGITLNATDKVRIYVGGAGISFNLFGSEIS